MAVREAEDRSDGPAARVATALVEVKPSLTSAPDHPPWLPGAARGWLPLAGQARPLRAPSVVHHFRGQ
eukprot:2545553-Alexandrium_andersonii.AAC.1